MALVNTKLHDFRLFKESKTNINPDIKIVANTSYKEIKKPYVKSDVAKERPVKIL